MSAFYPAEHYGPSSKFTATHRGMDTGDYYREPGSGSAVKWLVYREGKVMAGWVGIDGDDPSESLERLQQTR